MRDRAGVEELSDFLDGCNDLIHGEPARALEAAREAREKLAELKESISTYKYLSLRMRADGVFANALHVTGRSEQALKVFARAKSVRSAAPVERASLALRLARFHADRHEWDDALREADFAERHFSLHPPRPAVDGRSHATALVYRSTVLKDAYAAGVSLPGIVDPVSEAEAGYLKALAECTEGTPKTALMALINHNSLAVLIWWQTPKGRHRIKPGKVVATMKTVCRSLAHQKYGRKSVPHAYARWVMAIAIAERFGWLNRAAEERLQNALGDLLELGAIEDAARLCLDMCYLYYRESRWDDMAIVTATVLEHVQARGLPKSWYEALLLWQVAIEKGETAKVFIDVFEKIRGFRIRVPRLAVPSGDVHVPRQRYGDREDTGGL
jgi:tetratricopeptide (TPR) repeat protein